MEKNPQIIDLDELDLNNHSGFKVTEFKEKNRQKRLNAYHFVTHILAFLIILPYLIMIIFLLPIPNSYSTIVSMVIGFYFARSLFN